MYQNIIPALSLCYAHQGERDTGEPLLKRPRVGMSRSAAVLQLCMDPETPIIGHHLPGTPHMIGTSIGPYEILDQLGQGGMGIVYKARDTQLDRVVALKFLPGHLSQDESSKRRFVQEAKAASALDHANICTIHHIGETDDGATYIVMSYYKGQTLKYLLSERTFTEEEARGIIRQIAAGLARAHAAGIVHRDIKPANVMVTEHGEVKILDFGIAKLGESSDLTGEGSTLGTVAYMAPEQARGDEVGPTADLWSLGILFYEMLTGKRPFDATYDQALLYAILNEAPTDITATGVVISDETAELVHGLLAKKPADRIQTAGEVVKALGGSTGTVYTGMTGGAAAADPSSMMRVALGFAIGGVVGLGAVYAAMIFFGLPDWVFPLGVLLVLAGAPIMLYATRIERKKASMNTGQRATMSALASWLTVRRAAMGGVFALAALGLVAAGFMGLRAMGIGPAATLITSGALSSEDVIVVADFVDETPQGNMGRPIAEALRVDLSQSSVVKLMDGATVSSVLERMDLPTDTTITPDIAREVAQREGLKAALIGGVSSLGSSYVINLRLVDATNGSELVSLRETASSDDEVVSAVDRISASLREQIGESLVTIRASKPLAQVTTASFEALRLYTLAQESNERDDAVATIGFAQSAVEIDPEFATAYRLLATVENNRVGSYDRMIEYARKAYQYRDRLPRKEQLYATEAFYSWVEPNRDRQMQIYEELLALDPKDQRAINSLSLHHRYVTGDYQKSLEYTAQYIAFYPEQVQGYINHYNTLVRVGDFDQAQAMLDSIRVREPDYGGLPWRQLALDTERSRDYRAALDSIRVIRARGLTQGAEYYTDLIETSIHLMLGEHAAAERSLQGLIRFAREIESPDSEVLDHVWYLTYRVLADGDRNKAVADYDAMMAGIDFSETDTTARIQGERAYMLAAAGRSTQARSVMKEYIDASAPHTLAFDYYSPAVEGMIALNEERFDDAVTQFERVIELLKIPRMYEHELGMALLRAGRTEEAITRLESAAKSPGFQALVYDNGNSTLAYRSLGEAYEQAGDLDKAIEAYQVFVDRWANADSNLQPQVAEVRERIAQLAVRPNTDQ